MTGITKAERERRAAEQTKAEVAPREISEGTEVCDTRRVHLFTVPENQGVNLQDVSCIPIATRYEMSSSVGWPTSIDATTTPAEMVTTEGRWSVTLDGQTITCTQML
jgi:hypothetical protein